MRLGLSQSVRMDQRLQQSPQMIQAMQILQLSSLDLEDRIQQELVENPFLEVAEPGSGEGGPPDDEPSAAPAPAGEVVEEAGVRTMREELERYERDFDDGTRRSRAASSEDGDRKLEAMANTPDVEKTLAEVLVEELAILDLTERQRKLAEYLLWSLDDRGWLTQPLAEIARDCATPEPGEEPLFGPDEPPVTVEELQEVLEEIRSISHPALGAHDLRECLELQLRAMGMGDEPLLKAIVERHLSDVEQNKLPRIAKDAGATIEEVKDALELLRKLEPSPGAGFGGVQADVIHPDVIVEEVDGEYEVRLDRAAAPELRLSLAYKDVLKAAQKGDGVREWVKKRIESARWFLDALQQRRHTLDLIAHAIFAEQKGFLERGVEGLKPLRMQEIADQVGVHISTVSRAVAGKYAQTPRGIFPLKYFFTGGTQTETGEVAAQASVKQKIAALVAAEDPANPLSDEDLALRLEEKDQIRIARRTVTKYRKALNIPSSSQRKRF
ncbi:MAG: RNA polymerase factor sigma-54 [Planctomycetes bacterium]|nr:RNA polymerase factor sigma-54 [Planctomycetota bacterium]